MKFSFSYSSNNSSKETIIFSCFMLSCDWEEREERNVYLLFLFVLQLLRLI